MSKDTGGSAFPRKGGHMYYLSENTVDDVKEALKNVSVDIDGMTLRDYFAAKAMQGILTTLNMRGESQDSCRLSIICYDIADAMIAERNKDV